MDLPTPGHLIERTEEAGTAKLSCYLRLSSPVPDAWDLRGEGVADFRRDIVWVTDRLFTERMTRERRLGMRRLAWPIFWLISRSYERVAGGGKAVMFQGGAVRELEDDGAWGVPLGSLSGAKYPRHPLCMFGPLARAMATKRVERFDGSVQDAKAICLQVDLTRSEVDDQVWDEIQGGVGGAEDVLPVLLWIDDRDRILRLAFEGSRRYAEKKRLWSITEFSAFGLDITNPSVPVGSEPV
jgi:hypothetical protein